VQTTLAYAHGSEWRSRARRRKLAVRDVVRDNFHRKALNGCDRLLACGAVR
jgi:hypothetical protein